MQADSKAEAPCSRRGANAAVSQRVRFSHVDAAGIVFYPRYVEMIVNAYPEIGQGLSGRRLQFEFRNPAKLGESLSLQPAQNDDEFAIRASARDETIFEFQFGYAEHDQPAAMQAADVAGSYSVHGTVGSWMAGPGGQMHLSRYYELLSDTVEDWFTDELECSFADLRAQQGVGVPTVKLDSVIFGLPGDGSSFKMNLGLMRIGNRSITLEHRLISGAELLIRTQQVLVLVAHHEAAISSIPIPVELKEKLRVFYGAVL
ncbi:MAG TPA: hypothetical protein PKK10_08695 [Woeseiaceae bacterium]|nr:hypothetical protein [Woeseiaceae bacterium]